MVDRELGFSLWLDFIERDFLENEFSSMIEKGIINGATSNPAIFASAITSSPAYKEQLESLAGKSAKEKYEALAMQDIKTAAQALRTNYEEGNDGYISIEVDPFLSNDTTGTVEEGKRLFETIGEPNVMVKVPATEAGYEAMKSLLSHGISVNATLIFSPEQAMKCVEAMKEGIAASETKVNAVISVFVSRFDRMLDSKLEEAGVDAAKVGNYNAAKIYAMIESHKVPQIRTLFASTGVKGDALPADYYIRELFASRSVNTAPLATIEHYIKESATPAKLPLDMAHIDAHFESVEKAGINMEEVYGKLLAEGLVAFEEAFEEMLESIK
ncbi:transaldolase [Sulfurovum sp. zt1-1]|uniref:Transaldolase n=1 Tax=Sulfurovum zhangzhouensis TaxID=3019067 RepID=A0ABT7QX26_9BACT|nr:transaldolase [Sulfurovum zhangzhouensis]MDM5271342.1 transaldolase [Sulfurovum zhangzhouensis]